MKKPSTLLSLCFLFGVLAVPALLAQGPRLRPMAAIYLDPLGAGLRLPEAVAVDDGNRLAVADAGNRRLVIYTLTEDAATPVEEIRLAQVQYPLRVRFDSRGEILALDGKTSKIVRVGADGKFKGFVEMPIQDRQREVLVRSFDIDANDVVYVLAVSEGAVLVIDPQGGLTRQIAIPDSAGFLSDITVTSTGVVFAIDSVHKQVFVARLGTDSFEPLTEPMPEDMAFPTAIAADSFGNLFVADKTGGGIVVIGQNGEFRGRQSAVGWKVGFLRHPTGLEVGGDYLFVADRSNNRVQRFEIVQ